MNLIIKQANRKNQKLRLLLRGYSGSGKTRSALIIAKELQKSIPDSKIYYIDTENGSSELYSTDYNFQLIDYLENFGENFNPRNLIDVIKQLEDPNNILIIDSLSHFWDGKGGILEIQSDLGGRFQDWQKINPLYQEFVNSIIRSKSHMIVCARTKTDYQVLEGGKKVEKMGTKTVSREGLDYEFTTVIDIKNRGHGDADKDRTSLIPPEGVQIDANFAQSIIDWLSQGLPSRLFDLIDRIGLIYKKDRQIVIDGYLKKYKVAGLKELTELQINEFMEELNTVTVAYDTAVSKKIQERQQKITDFIETISRFAISLKITELEALRTVIEGCNVPYTGDANLDVSRIPEENYKLWMNKMNSTIKPEKVVEEKVTQLEEKQ